MRVVWIVALLVGLLGAVPGAAQQRHALVVGMQDYGHVTPLQKATNDARAVAAALEQAGFATELVLDAGQIDLLSALSGLGNRLGPGDEAVFYYAGHGVEIEGQNYLLPVDIPALGPGQELVLKRRSLALEDVLGELTGRGARVSLLIIDACRDNPFPKEGTRTVGGTRGLTRVDPPEGTYVVYSAGAGQTALDRLSDADPDPNSVFTRALLPRLKEPGKSLREMVLEVRSDVRRTAQSIRHDQFPAIYDQLEGEFFFIPAAAPTPQAEFAVPVATAPASPLADPCAAARNDWALIQSTETQEVLQSFAAVHAQCSVFAALARERLAALGPAEGVPQPGAHEVEGGTIDWTRATVKVLEGHADKVTSAAISPDGRRIVTASMDRTARIWDAESGREIATLHGHWEGVLGVAFSPDGRRIVTASRDTTARIWDAESGREIATFNGHSEGVRSPAFSPDGRRIVTASADKTARIWNAESGQEIATLRAHLSVVVSAAFSPDGRWVVSASWDRTARIWDAESGREIATLHGHSGGVTQATFSPDGRRIVTASFDTTARIWDAESGREIATLHGHSGGVTQATFSPDGGRIVTASADNTAKIWDAASGREIGTLQGHSDVVWGATFSPDGRRIVTASFDTTARIWDAP